MKSVIYINKSKVWFGDRAYDWSNDTLEGIFSTIKKETKIDEVRIVLGSEIGYVIDFKIDDISNARREVILKMSKSWLPFVVTDDCFDWKLVKLGESDLWAQVIAAESAIMEVISKAIQKSGIRVQWVIPVGVALGMVSVKKEAPILIKWKGKENLNVLAQNGLVDYVGSDNDELINNFAKRKWNLEVFPEQMILNEANFVLNEWVESGKVKGNDSEILGLNLLKRKNQNLEGVIPASLEGVVGGENVTELEVNQSVEKKGVNLWLWIILLISVLVMGGVLWWNFGRENKVVEENLANQNTPQVVATVTPEQSTASAKVIDYSLYKIQVLNGSGISGEAGRLGAKLSDAGFTNVVVGNSPTEEVVTLVSYKASLPAEVLAKVMETISNYEIGNVLFLTNDSQYDLIVVVGSSVKI